jgi:plastocyanin
MNKQVGIAVAAVVIVGAGVGVYFASQGGKEAASPTPQATVKASAKPSAVASASTQGTVEIKYTSSGFSPKTVTIKAGGTLKITNESGGSMQFNSDPHPSHTNLPGLNVGSIGAGSSAQVTLTKKGTFGAHNHLKPSDKVTIVVE